MQPTIKFECGVEVNAGEVAMAINAHIQQCTNETCIADCLKSLEVDA